MAASEPKSPRRSLLAIGLATALSLLPTRLPAGQPFTVICYHDVSDERSRAAADTIALRRLIEHFEWLKAEGWTPVSVADLLAARAGGKPLPAKAVVLTFDDGYTSFATRMLPLLELYRYPAVFAFVTEWIAPAPGSQVAYGDGLVPRERFVSREQLQAIARSPWVEIASHSDALHHAVLANREGNELPAAIARRFDPATGTYEDDAAFTARVRTDLERSAAVLESLTDRRPRTLVWPFGRYNAAGIAAAQAAGYSVMFGLQPGRGDTDRLDSIPRYYPARNPDAAGLAGLLVPEKQPGPHRFTLVDPADIAAKTDPAEREAGLGRLIDATRLLGLTAVHLEAFSGHAADGRPAAAYFPGSQFSTGPDYLGRMAWQLRTRAGVSVVLRVPLTGTAEADWRALGRIVPFDGVMFSDFVCGRDDPARLQAALRILREYQPEAKLHLRVAATPAAAGDWTALKPTLVWPEHAGADRLEAWLRLPAARGRVALALPRAKAAHTDDWLARGLVHFGLDGPPPAKETVTPALQRAFSAGQDPFSQP
jgi:biofilm PGA synthesis lipoprotein PgaB